MVSLHQYFRFSRDLLEQWNILLKSMSSTENNEAHSRTSCLVRNFNFPFCVFFFILPGHRCVALLPARQVTWREKLQQKVVYFLRRLRSAYGRFFQQNFWLFANWRQELSYTLHILQTPKQTGLVLARGLIRLHKLFSLLFLCEIKKYIWSKIQEIAIKLSNHGL